MTWEVAGCILLGIWSGLGLVWWLTAGSLVFRAAQRSECPDITSTDHSSEPPISVFKVLPALNESPPGTWLLETIQQLACSLAPADQLILGVRSEDERVWGEKLIDSLKTKAKLDQDGNQPVP